MPVTKASALDDIQFVRTGLFPDKLIGRGGIPRGYLLEFVGEPGAGKSTINMQLCAALQKFGYKCLWVDVELSFDTRYAQSLGMDMNTLDILTAESAEEILGEIEERVGDYDFIFLDSVGALTTRGELEKKPGEVVMAGASRILSPFIRKIIWKLKYHQTSLFVINHLRDNFATGAKEASGGGKLNYHKSVSIRMKVLTDRSIKQGEHIVGRVVQADVWKKNKFNANVGTKINVNLMNSEGFSAAQDLLQDAIEEGIFERRGNTYYLNGDKVGMIGTLREWIKIPENTEKIQELLG